MVGACIDFQIMWHLQVFHFFVINIVIFVIIVIPGSKYDGAWVEQQKINVFFLYAFTEAGKCPQKL